MWFKISNYHRSSSKISTSSGRCFPFHLGRCLPVHWGRSLPAYWGRHLPIHLWSMFPVHSGKMLPVHLWSMLPVHSGRMLPVHSGSMLPVHLGRMLPVHLGRMLPVHSGRKIALIIANFGLANVGPKLDKISQKVKTAGWQSKALLNMGSIEKYKVRSLLLILPLISSLIFLYTHLILMCCTVIMDLMPVELFYFAYILKISNWTSHITWKDVNTKKLNIDTISCILFTVCYW